MSVLTLAQENGTQIVGAGLFYGFATLTLLSAWAIVLTQNIIRQAVYLLLTLAGVAGLYFMLHAEILAAIQLIVYAGGTLILIIFGVMLTSRNPFAHLKVKGWEFTVGLLIGLTLTGLMVWMLANTKLHRGPDNVEEGYGAVERIGKGVLSDFIVPFEVAAVVLLVVMIGAAYMARKRAK